jgi:hypothetical protein
MENNVTKSRRCLANVKPVSKPAEGFESADAFARAAIRDATGKVVARSSTDSSGTVTNYDSRGRVIRH